MAGVWAGLTVFLTPMCVCGVGAAGVEPSAARAEGAVALESRFENSRVWIGSSHAPLPRRVFRTKLEGGGPALSGCAGQEQRKGAELLAQPSTAP